MDKSRQKYLIRLLDSYCEPMQKTLRGFITIITIATIVQVASISLLVAALINDFGNYQKYWYYFVIIVITFLVKSWAVYARTRHTQKVAGQIRKRIREEIVARCKILGEKGLGYNTTTMSIFYIEQIDLLNNYIARFYPQTFASRIQPVLILIAVFVTNWVAGAVLLLTFPLLPIFMILIGNKTAEMNARQLKALLYLGNQFHDKMTGIKTIISFSQQEKVLQKITLSSMEYTRTTVDLLKIAFLNSAFLEFLSAICIALMALYFGLTYLEGTSYGSYTGAGVTLAVGFFCLTLAGEFFMPLKDLGAFYHDRSSALNAIDELDKFINQQAIENSDFIDITNTTEYQLTTNTESFSLNSNRDQAIQQELNEETKLETVEIETKLQNLANKLPEASTSVINKDNQEDQNKTNKKTKSYKRKKLPPIFLDAKTAPRIKQLNYPFSLNTDKHVKFTPATLVNIDNLAVYTHSGKKLIDNLNLSFSLKDKVAIIGLSGAGKTTLLSALLGLYPYTGSIKFDNVELTELNPQEFYSYFSWLGQNPNLDQVSILENLEFKGDYLENHLDTKPIPITGLSTKEIAFQNYLIQQNCLSDYSIKEVIKLAKIDDIISQKGLDYQIQQHNIGLSGGQVQRIALARALAKPHLFLVIDEPTANLDQKLEQAVFNNITQHQQGVLMVTHRLKHTQAFDVVYNLDHQGLHLVAKGEF